MKKNTLLLIVLASFLTANAHQGFNPSVAHANDAKGSAVSINPKAKLVANIESMINQPADFIVCDDSDGNVDGITEFDLTSFDTEVTNDPNIVISYHSSVEDANNGTAALTSPYSSAGEVIHIRAENTVTGNYDTTSFNLVVNILPLATFDPKATYEVLPNAASAIQLVITPLNFEASKVSVNWFLDDSPISGGNGLTLDNVSVEGNYTAEIISNDTGCVNTITQYVRELATCVIPEGISPGVSPGFNDNFDLSCFDVTKLEIFNRYGTLVYSKNNYRDEWVGQTNDGNELPVGTYFYTMEYEGGTKGRSAWIYINR